MSHRRQLPCGARGVASNRGALPAKLAEYERVATVLVTDIAAVGAIITATGGVVREGPSDAPNGPRMIARHADGAVFEYIEMR